MKLLFALLAFVPLGAYALLGLGGGSPAPAPEIDGPVAVLAVTLVVGVASLVKRARDKRNSDRAE